MKDFFGQLLFWLFAAAIAWVAWQFLIYGIKKFWPAQIPADLAFEHEIESTLKTREVAEALWGQFKPSEEPIVRCLGPVRGNAARLLFHSGPTRKRGNIYRLDYILFVDRLGKRRMKLRLGLNRPYSYVRIDRSEVAPLAEALRESYGALESV